MRNAAPYRWTQEVHRSFFVSSGYVHMGISENEAFSMRLGVSSTRKRRFGFFKTAASVEIFQTSVFTFTC